MLFNKTAVKKSINFVGVVATLTTFVDKDSPSYDIDTEVPNYNSGTVRSVRVQMEAPSKNDIYIGGGKITVDNKKFIIDKDVDVGLGDQLSVTIGSVPETYEIFHVFDRSSMTVGFGVKLE